MQRQKLGVELVSMAAIGVVLALMGPFGTIGLPLVPRLLDWQMFIFGGYCVFRPVVSAGSLVAQHGGIPRWLAIGLACVLAAMPVTVLVAWALGGMAWRGLTLETLAAIYPDIVLVGAAVTVMQVIAAQARAATPKSAGDPALRTPAQTVVPDQAMPAAIPSPAIPTPAIIPRIVPRFLARLPVGHDEGLIALESEDHYVRVHCRAGSTLVLLRLSDAVAELDGIEGLRTHRSWWVARSAVAEVLRRDRAVSLRLVNGIEVPVARNVVAQLRGAGWL